MRGRTFIFDIYGTLLEVGPPPLDAEARWSQLCDNLGDAAQVCSLVEFDSKCRLAIAQAHAIAKARGVRFPEVNWTEITRKVLPELENLHGESLETFLYHHARLQRTVRLMPGAGKAISELRRQGAVLGLCSNCQSYTLRELGHALGGAALAMMVFDPKLCFYSFQAGFSKPEPMVFKRLRDELDSRSVLPSEVMYVGDRLDNDIRPAQAEGWRTWQLSTTSQEPGCGNWSDFLQCARQWTEVRH